MSPTLRAATVVIHDSVFDHQSLLHVFEFKSLRHITELGCCH